MPPIYLDHNATTPMAPEIVEAMLPYLREAYGNPSSAHAWGRQARAAIDRARRQVADLIHANQDEIVFTSGGTEAANLALRGVAEALPGLRILVSAVEHPAVLGPAQTLEAKGVNVTTLPVDSTGYLDVQAAIECLEGPHETLLVSVMFANNDVGTLQPLEALIHAAKGRPVLFHSDAVQAAGRIPIDVQTLRVDLLSLSAHKLYGPKGIGALYVRRGTPLVPLMRGGKQEQGLRPGTENVAGIVGFGAACALAAERLNADAQALKHVRDAFESTVLASIPGVKVNGNLEHRLPNTSNLHIQGLDANMAVLALDLEGIAASVGSACVSGSREPSHVLLAMGLTPEEARASLRFSFGRGQTPEDAAIAAQQLARVVRRLRGQQP